MTNQELFDKTVAHLRAQGSKSYLDAGLVTCAYRGRDGKKCAAGVHILDEHYSPKFEGENISSTLVWESLKKSGLSNGNFDLLRELQVIHDGIDIKDWEYIFHDVAVNYNLTYTAP